MHAAGGHTLTIAACGLSVSVVAPALVLATRSRGLWRRIALPWPVALPLFLVVHAAAVLAHGGHPHLRLPPWTPAVAPLTAVWFWWPVLGRGRRRLTDAGRCLYLFLAAPSLDLPAVATIALGENTGGITVIVSMLPVGLAAVVVTWRWVMAEERRARLAPAGFGPPRPAPPDGGSAA